MVVTNVGRLVFVGTVIGTCLSFALLRLVIASITDIASPPIGAVADRPTLVSRSGNSCEHVLRLAGFGCLPFGDHA